MNRIDNYRVNILKSKKINNIVLLSIPFILPLVPFVKKLFNKNFTDLLTAPNICCLIIWLLLLVVYYIFWFHNENIVADRNYLDEEIIAFNEIANSYDKLKNKYNSETNYLDRAVSMTTALDIVVRNLAPLLYSNNIAPQDFKSALCSTFSFVFKAFNNFYNLTGERITIALYYYCDQTREFFDIESIKPEIFGDFAKKPKGRIWSINDESHICYVARRQTENEYVFDDINAELNKPLNLKPFDEIRYVSSISIPLFDTNGNVISVFSITSNIPSRFNRDNSVSPVVSYLNRIFVDIFFDIAKLIEIVLNKCLNNENNKKILESIILKEYLENTNYLKEYHLQMLANLSQEVVLND